MRMVVCVCPAALASIEDIESCLEEQNFLMDES